MLTNKELLIEAHKCGHAWNPAYPNLRGLTLGQIKKMDGTERDAKDLIASRQASDANMDGLVGLIHNRRPQFDGDIGPATRALAEIPRCGIPDFAPPPEFAVEYNDPELTTAVKSYQEFGEAYVGGKGSWPLPGCDPLRTNVHSVVVNVITSAASTNQKNLLKQILALVEKCEAEIGQSVRHVIDGNPSKAHHDVRFQNIPGGVIGFAYFPRPGTCNQTVVARIDNSYNPGAITLANLFTHEYKGHSDGLEHTRGGIMNPSIITINPLSWIKDTSESVKRRFFGGKPIDDGPVIPPPPPPPPAGKLHFQGTLTAVDKSGQKLGEFIVIEKPDWFLI